MTRFKEWLEEHQADLNRRIRDLYAALDFDSDEIIPGWRISLHKPENKDAYVVALVGQPYEDREMATKRHIVASDQSGVIREGDLSPIQELSAAYMPLDVQLPGLHTLAPPRGSVAMARLGNAVRRIALISMQEKPQQTACQYCCGCDGNCLCNGQCLCYNCGFPCETGCTWCCFAFCGTCLLCCGYCACC